MLKKDDEDKEVSFLNKKIRRESSTNIVIKNIQNQFEQKKIEQTLNRKYHQEYISNLKNIDESKRNQQFHKYKLRINKLDNMHQHKLAIGRQKHLLNRTMLFKKKELHDCYYTMEIKQLVPNHIENVIGKQNIDILSKSMYLNTSNTLMNEVRTTVPN